ncbi:MAG: RluA family pseudouridine synthase [Planctomycetaceae bacterium]
MTLPGELPRSRQPADGDAPDADGNSIDTDDEQQLPSNIAGEAVDLTVESRAHGWRLDHYLSRLFANHSRAELQRAIEAGHVLLNGLTARPSRRLRVNDRITLRLPEAESRQFKPENIPIDVLYEDDAIVVINKSAGMVVHPGRGTYSGTLAAALQFHFDQLSDVAGRHRPGIVHRLDRDTTGVILVAKDNQIHQRLSRQFENREVAKEYRAIVRGHPELNSDFIRTYVCVHPRIREKMTVCSEGGNAREAVTFYKVAEAFSGYSLMELHPHTGRTHQLRVHMQHIGTPIIADKLYIGESRLTRRDLAGANQADASSPGPDDDVLIERQALHAFRLTIQHPVSGKPLTIEAPYPPDFVRTLNALRQV